MSWIRRLGCIMGAAHRSPPRHPSLPGPAPVSPPARPPTLPCRLLVASRPPPVSPRPGTHLSPPGNRLSLARHPFLPSRLPVSPRPGTRRWSPVAHGSPRATRRPDPASPHRSDNTLHNSRANWIHSSRSPVSYYHYSSPTLHFY